jgi:hypothetical protein
MNECISIGLWVFRNVYRDEEEVDVIARFIKTLIIKNRRLCYQDSVEHRAHTYFVYISPSTSLLLSLR